MVESNASMAEIVAPGRKGAHTYFPTLSPFNPSNSSSGSKVTSEMNAQENRAERRMMCRLTDFDHTLSLILLCLAINTTILPPLFLPAPKKSNHDNDTTQSRFLNSSRTMEFYYSSNHNFGLHLKRMLRESRIRKNIELVYTDG